MEKRIKREEIYKGKIINVVKDDVILDNGKTSIREVVLHNGGACIALKDKDDKYFLVKQYRYVFNEELYEFCAGKIEVDENPDETILREVEEELGYTAKNIKSFGYIIPTCGYCSEKIYLYYGEVDTKVNQHFDEGEYMEVEKYSFEEIKEMIKEGKIVDGKTIALAYKLEIDGIEH